MGDPLALSKESQNIGEEEGTAYLLELQPNRFHFIDPIESDWFLKLINTEYKISWEYLHVLMLAL